MKGIVRYTIYLNGKVTVNLPGNDSEDNFFKAKEMAIQNVLKEIDEDWIDDVRAEEFEEEIA
jgi:hypothetical protein